MNRALCESVRWPNRAGRRSLLRPSVARVALAGLLATASLSACGGGASASFGEGADSGGLTPAEVRPALATLPYSIDLKTVEPPAHDSAAFLGTAVGPHHTVLEFTIGLGNQAFAVPLPGIGTMHAISNGAAGFAFNSNSSVGKDFPSNARWKEVAKMEVEIEERLCRRATGEACPV